MSDPQVQGASTRSGSSEGPADLHTDHVSLALAIPPSDSGPTEPHPSWRQVARANTVSLYATAGELTPREAEGESDEGAADCTRLTFFPALHESQHSEDFLELCRERQVILQELLDREKVRRPVVSVLSGRSDTSQ